MTSAVVKRERKSSALSSGPGYWIRLGYRAIVRSLSEELRAHGIAFNHYLFLRALFEEDGITQRELADRLGAEPATVTVVLDAMEGLGIVERRDHDNDRRKTNVFLTKKSERLRRPILDSIAASNRIVLRGITPGEFAAFQKTLARMIDNVNELRP
jgi:DNA-binding MarR family transcriptional regulator